MKIIGRRGQGNLGYVRPVLMCPQLGINSPIRMVVDTGASRTVISERDALRLNIDYSTLTPEPDALGVGGLVKCYSAGQAALTFKVSRNSWHTERLDSLHFLKCESDDPIERLASLRLSSLLGIDILDRYSVRFTRTRIYLEK